MASIERSPIKVYTQEGCGECGRVVEALAYAGVIDMETRPASELAATDEGLRVIQRCKGKLPVLRVGGVWLGVM